MATNNTPNSNIIRAAVLERVRNALQDVPATEQPADVSVARDYQTTTTASRAEIVEQFIEYTIDYKATVHQVKEADLPARIVQSCREHGVKRLVVPTDLPKEWLPTKAGIEVVPDNNLTYADLEASDGVLTGCALAIAQTGTIVLDGGQRQGRRVISLLPDYHLCVVYAEQVVGIVPEAIEALQQSAVEHRRPITFISGPSATSDIELNRVEGVHGPRTLEVLVVS